MKYASTVKAFAERIAMAYPDARVKMEEADKDLFRKGVYFPSQFPAYLLWMMRELQTFDDERKVGSWMGWVAKAMDSTHCLDLVTNQECRDLMRSDKESPQWPKFLMRIGDARWFLPIWQAGPAYDLGWVKVEIAGDVLESDGHIRPITAEEKQQIREAAEEHSSGK
ncbi:MAG TPA: hypothetical protein VI937_02140 [Negativicutes bacterium]|nr:hypothetical protein [Negativicutes bacterium]